MRQVLHPQCFRSQDARAQNRQGRILGPRNLHLTGERDTPLNDQFVHDGVCRLLIGPLLWSKCTHRKRVDFLAHTIAKRTIDNLMLLDTVLVAKLGADDHGLEMVAITDYLDVFARQAFLNI